MSLDSCVWNIKGKDVMKEGYSEEEVWKIFMREVSYMILLEDCQHVVKIIDYCIEKDL